MVPFVTLRIWSSGKCPQSVAQAKPIGDLLGTPYLDVTSLLADGWIGLLFQLVECWRLQVAVVANLWRSCSYVR